MCSEVSVNNSGNMWSAREEKERSGGKDLQKKGFKPGIKQ